MMLAYQKSCAAGLLLGLALTFSCQKPVGKQLNSTTEVKTAEPEIPAWLQRRITDFQQDKPANPPVKIYRYLYQDQEVYYISGRCCDIPSEVYDSAGKQLCQPDGGITGRGDGKCPDFPEARNDEKLIWEDLRN